MKLSFTTYRIFLKHPFGISRSSNNWYDIVLLFLQDGDIIGRGEAAPSIRYKESTEKILSVLNRGVNIPQSENITLEKMQNFIYPQLGNLPLFFSVDHYTDSSVRKTLSMSSSGMTNQ